MPPYENPITDNEAKEWYGRGYDYCYEVIDIYGSISRSHYKDHCISTSLFLGYFKRDSIMNDTKSATIYRLSVSGKEVHKRYERT